MCLYTGYIFDSAPDEHELIQLLADVNHLWYEIGTVLRVPNTKLESLYQQSKLSDSIKMIKVIQCWINQCTTEVTWNTIIAAMRNKIVGQDRVGKTIETYVLNINQGGETPSKKYSRVPVEPQRSEYSMLLK